MMGRGRGVGALGGKPSGCLAEEQEGQFSQSPLAKRRKPGRECGGW